MICSLLPQECEWVIFQNFCVWVQILTLKFIHAYEMTALLADPAGPIRLRLHYASLKASGFLVDDLRT